MRSGSITTIESLAATGLPLASTTLTEYGHGTLTFGFAGAEIVTLIGPAARAGPALADVVFGYVYDLGTGEEWTARRGGGAFLNGARLGAVRPKDEIEILSFEATTTAFVAERVQGMVGLAERLRVMGSLALSLCHLAAGRADAGCSLKPARSVDIASAALLVRECSLAIELFDDPPFAAGPLDLGARSRVAAAGTPELCERLAAALR